MTTWVVAVADGSVRVMDTPDTGELQVLFAAAGDTATLAAQAADYLTNNPIFDAIVLSGDRALLPIYSAAFEPDLARLIVAEDTWSESDTEIGRLKERFKPHKGPKGRGKKWQ